MDKNKTGNTLQNIGIIYNFANIIISYFIPFGIFNVKNLHFTILPGVLILVVGTLMREK